MIAVRRFGKKIIDSNTVIQCLKLVERLTLEQQAEILARVHNEYNVNFLSIAMHAHKEIEVLLKCLELVKGLEPQQQAKILKNPYNINLNIEIKKAVMHATQNDKNIDVLARLLEVIVNLNDDKLKNLGPELLQAIYGRLKQSQKEDTGAWLQFYYKVATSNLNEYLSQLIKPRAFTETPFWGAHLPPYRSASI